MYHDILEFWFGQLKPAQWWKKDESLDQMIRQRFLDVHARACWCELFEWRSEARGRLAEIIVLDQFSRNMFRNTPQAFAHDALALALAQEAVSTGAGTSLNPDERHFLYMPFMHSESLIIHKHAIGLFRNNGQPVNYESALRHMAIIERFGRYPHRNEILGRESSDAEKEFLKQPGSRF